MTSDTPITTTCSYCYGHYCTESLRSEFAAKEADLLTRIQTNRELRKMTARGKLVHAVAQCTACQWRCEDYLTAQKKGRAHATKTGHRVLIETAYAGWYGA